MIWAKVTTQFQGYHQWPDAKGAYSFLANRHRHMFHITAWIEQHHNDRDIEYIEFKDWLDSHLKSGDLDNRSCEMIAQELALMIKTRWGENRAVGVEVTEDGENGALVEM